MEVTRYQFSRSANSSEERVLAHYSEVSLLLEGRSDFPEELKGTKKGMLYLTQYKMIFQHKDKGSTIIRFPLQLLGDCVLEEELGSKPQHIKGTLTSTQGVLVFKFTFQYGASDCLNTIKDLIDADILREGTNLQEYPTASIYTYAYPSAPRAARSLSMLPLWPPPYPGPPDLPPPYSEVEGTSPRGSRGSDFLVGRQFSWASNPRVSKHENLKNRRIDMLDLASGPPKFSILVSLPDAPMRNPKAGPEHNRISSSSDSQVLCL